MNPDVSQSIGLKWLLGSAAFIIVLAGLKSAEAIFVPIMLAFFIAIICAPFLVFMTRKGVPIFLAIIIILFGLFFFGALVTVFVGSSVDTFMTRLPDYQLKLNAQFDAITPWLIEHGVPVTREEALTHLNSSLVINLASSAMSSLGSMLTNMFLILFIVIFLLLEGALIGEKVKLAFGEASFKSTASIQGFMSQVNKYLLIKGIISLVVGVLVTLWLWIMKVDFPLMWGLIALLMNFIPNVGSILASIPAVLLALIQFGFPEASLVALGYLVINTVMGNLIEPRFMGDGLGLSPLVVFLSLVVWGWLFGIVGMFLSIPITMILKLALEHNPQTRWIAILMGSGKQDLSPTLEPPAQAQLETSATASKVPPKAPLEFP